jgi:enoyl-CoA hydratase
MDTAVPATPEVLGERRGALGLITLNRPRAINALTHGMVLEIDALLDRFEDDDEVATVAITGAGERGLCAGGDIVALYRDAVDGDGSAAASFWRDEYRLNARIARYPKPVVAVQDGIVLGGGIGISAHGSHRVVTERSRLGLPETGIGFVPDVGATGLLSRAPGHTGTLLALTGRHIGAADAIAVGLSDWYVPSERIGRLLTGLEHDTPGAVIAALAEDVGRSSILDARDWADECFDHEWVADVLDAIDDDSSREATDAARAIRANSPTAVAVTLSSLRRAAALTSLEDVLRQEFRVSCGMHRVADFAEGVRAQVIDKDRTPHWQPGWDAVSTLEIDSFFAPLDHDLDFDRAEQDAATTTEGVLQ